MNYYRRFIGDYQAHTNLLNLLEHGAYTLLLDYLYASETRIQSEDDAMRICRATTETERSAVEKILQKFFKKTASGFTNKRYEKELKQRKNWCKWQKNHRHTNPDKPMTVRPMSSRSPSPTPSPTKEESNTYARKWPEGLFLSQEMKEAAIAGGVEDPEAEFSAWHDDCLAHGRKYQNWMAAWRTRITNYPKFRGGTSGTRQPDTSREQQRAERSQQAIKNALGHRSRLADTLRANIPGGNHGRTGTALPGSTERHSPSGSTPGVSESSEDLQIPPDTSGGTKLSGNCAGQLAHAETHDSRGLRALPGNGLEASDAGRKVWVV